MVDKVIRIKIDSSGASRNIRNLDGEMRNLGQSADQTSQAFGKLKSVAQAVAGALATQQIIKYADAFTSIQNQIRQTVSSTEELTQRTGELLEVANRSRGEFGTVAELYTQLNLSTQELGLSSSELLRVTETISKSFAVSGKSAAESAGAIRQLAQGLAAGALRGDEFNSVAEGAPEIMRALQRELKMNQGELREFAATGGITSKILIQALGNAGDVIDEKLNNSIATLSQKMTIAENNMTQFIGSAQSVQGAVGTMGDIVVTLSKNLDTIANVVLIAAIVGFGKLSAQMIMNTVETVKNTAAKIANANATTGLSAALGVQAQRMTAATIVMRTMTAAGTALRGVMAFLGGPLGIAITAASAIAFFATKADEAVPKVDDLSGSVERLTDEFSGLSELERETKLTNLTAELKKLNEEAIKVNDDYLKAQSAAKEAQERFNAALASGKEALINETIELKNAKDRAAELKNELEELRKKQQEVNAQQMALISAGLPTPIRTGEQVEEVVTTGGDDSFVNTERFRTEAMKNELAERIRLNKIFNESIVSMTAERHEKMRAQSEAERLAQLAMLERDKADMTLRFEEEREAILTNTRLTEEGRLLLLAELEQQELIQKQIFEQDKISIEQDAAERRKEIAQEELMFKINQMQGFASTALALDEAFGSKSEKAQKRRRRAGVIIDTAAGIARAYAENNFYVATGMAAFLVANAKKQLDAINSASSIAAPAASAGGGFQQEPAQRQEVPQQTTAIEFRGLAEVAAELRNLDPGETLPVEYTQRIVASLAEFERLSGGGD